MISHTTIQSSEQFFLNNDAIFMDALKKIDPELMLVKTYLMHTGLSAGVLPPIIEELSQLTKDRDGKLEIEVRDGKVIFCKRITESFRGINVIKGVA